MCPITTCLHTLSVPSDPVDRPRERLIGKEREPGVRTLNASWIQLGAYNNRVSATALTISAVSHSFSARANPPFYIPGSDRPQPLATYRSPTAYYVLRETRWYHSTRPRRQAWLALYGRFWALAYHRRPVVRQCTSASGMIGNYLIALPLACHC